MTDVNAVQVSAPEVREIPVLRDEKGNLRKLKSRDFPRNREGQQAFCEYKALCFEQIAAEWRKRKEEIVRADDPKFQKQRKIERLQAMLAKLEQEVSKD